MRVALLTNFIPPYRVSLFKAIADLVGELRVFASTEMEGNRSWRADFGSLDVVVQQSVTLKRIWKEKSFQEPYELHIPYDTIIQLRRFQPDVIITGELGMRSMQAMVYGKATKTPVVLWATLSERTEQNRGLSRRVLRKSIIPRFDAVIVNGHQGARYISGFRTDPPLRIPYTTDMGPLLALPLENRGRAVLYVGALSHRKGFHFLLDACQERGFQLIVVGTGPLQKQVAGVTYAGAVEYADLPYWYKQARFLVMPSLADEWGLVVNEALAAGVPVVGSVYSQAVDELIVDGHNGWRFEPRSAADVTAAIDRALATGDQEFLQMRIHARETVQTLHPEIAAARIWELIKSL